MPELDRDKLRARLRRLPNEDVFYLLDEAIDLLPPASMVKLFSPYMDVKQLQPDTAPSAGKRTLLSDTMDFDARSRAGHYYEGFAVNSRNYRETSPGTRAFIADCRRLLERCVAEAAKGDPAETRASFELIFDLLRRIDKGEDDVVFADEGGSWQVGVDWATVFPAWFRCLARTVEPEEFAHLVVETVDDFSRYDRDKHFATAKKCGTAGQRRALDQAVQAARGGR